MLEALCASGVPGLLVLLGGAGLAWLAWRAARRAGRREASYALAALVAGAVAHQFFAVQIAAAAYAALALGLLVGCAAPQAAAAGRFPGAARAASWGAGLVLLVLALRLTVADVQMERAREALVRRDAESALLDYEQARAWAVRGVTGDLWMARNLVPHARSSPEGSRYLAAALEAARRATVTAEDPQNAWQTLAYLLVIRGDAASATEAYRQALRIAPRWRQPREMMERLGQRPAR